MITVINARKENSIIQRPYQCDFCLKSFYRLEHKVRHVRTHTGERPHVCTYKNCDKKFARSDELSRHLKVHTSPPSILLQRRKRLRKFNSTKSKSTEDEEAYLKQQEFCSILRFIHPHHQEMTKVKSTPTSPKRSSPYKQSNTKLNHCPASNCYKSFWRKGQLGRHIEKQHQIVLTYDQLDNPDQLDFIFQNAMYHSNTTSEEEDLSSNSSTTSEDSKVYLSPPILPSFSPTLNSLDFNQPNQKDIRLPSIQSLLESILI